MNVMTLGSEESRCKTHCKIGIFNRNIVLCQSKLIIFQINLST